MLMLANNTIPGQNPSRMKGNTDEILPTYRPNIHITPIYNRMHPHEVRPSAICAIKMSQTLPVRICAARPHKNGLDLCMLLQILDKRQLHGLGGRAHQREMVGASRGMDKALHLGKGVPALRCRLHLPRRHTRHASEPRPSAPRHIPSSQRTPHRRPPRLVRTSL